VANENVSSIMVAIQREPVSGGDGQGWESHNIKRLRGGRWGAWLSFVTSLSLALLMTDHSHPYGLLVCVLLLSIR
jgi:hypothetical protein